MKPKFAGIDYSISSPAFCILDRGRSLDPKNCHHYYFGKGTASSQPGGIRLTCIQYPTPHPAYPTTRYHYLARAVVERLQAAGVTTAYIEDYAYGARGKAKTLSLIHI